MFDISDKSMSCTQVPGYYPLDSKEQIFLVDCPGFGDSNQFAEFPNQTLVHELIMNSRSTHICVVVRGTTIEAARGDRFLKVITSILRFLSPNGVQNCTKLVTMLVNNTGSFRKPKALEGAIGKLEQFLQEKAASILHSYDKNN